MSTIINIPLPVVTATISWRSRYEAAYQKHYRETYPAAFKDHGYIKIAFPSISKSNGLTQAIIKFICWEQGNADRSSTQGRLTKGIERLESGNRMTVTKWLPSANRPGTADVSATIKGRSVKIEIKVGHDTPSDKQLAEQIRERRAGGIYEFIHDMDEFFILYDKIVAQATQQQNLF
jgi:hypothetical protein